MLLTVVMGLDGNGVTKTGNETKSRISGPGCTGDINIMGRFSRGQWGISGCQVEVHTGI